MHMAVETPALCSSCEFGDTGIDDLGLGKTDDGVYVTFVFLVLSYLTQYLSGPKNSIPKSDIQRKTSIPLDI